MSMVFFGPDVLHLQEEVSPGTGVATGQKARRTPTKEFSSGNQRLTQKRTCTYASATADQQMMISKMNTQMSWHHNQQTKTRTARRNASEPCQPRIDISVTFLDGHVFGIKFEPSASVARVIRRAARRIGVSPNELRLYLRTDRLEATQLLCECGIEDGATLHAVIRDVVPLVVRSAHGERRTICIESSDALEQTMSQACAAFRLPLSQQQHMRLVDRGRVLEVGTFRTLLGLGVGAGSELMLTSETITSIGDHRSNYSFHEHVVEPCDYDRRAVNWTCDGCGKNGDSNIGLDYLPFSLPPLQRFRCTMGCDFDLCSQCWHADRAARGGCAIVATRRIVSPLSVVTT